MKRRSRLVTREDCKECVEELKESIRVDIADAWRNDVPDEFDVSHYPKIVEALAETWERFKMKIDFDFDVMNDLLQDSKGQKVKLILKFLRKIDLKDLFDHPKTLQELLDVTDENVDIEVLYELLVAFDKKMELANQGRNNALCAQCCIQSKHYKVIDLY